MWDALNKAFEESDGFTVHFILKSGTELELACSQPYLTRQYHIAGELITADRAPVTIRADEIAAYWIEES